ncbi:MAG: GAF domain-containing protein [Trueperaceae bacterium]|nr:GAF domain-containing protein [Trueperaceae bacterium]
MIWSLTSYSVALALTALTLAGLAGVAWSRRANTRGARSFTYFMLAGMVWAALEAVQLSDPDPARQFMWLQLKFLGVAFVPVAFLAFAHDYTRGAEWVNRFTITMLMIVPIVTVVLAWTNELHHVLWTEVGSATVDGRLRLVTESGDWFWVHASYSYLLLALGSFYMVRGFVLTPVRYRAQVSLVLAAVLVPWLANALSLTGVLLLPDLDVTPLTFSFSALAFARSLFSHRLLDIVPVAQETVMRYLSDAVVVADARQRILQVNPAAARLLGVDDPGTLVGKKTGDVFMHSAVLLERLGRPVDAQVDVALPTPSGTRHFNVHLTPLADRRGRITGHLVRLQDIERQVEAEATLARAETALREQEQYVKALQDVSEGLFARRALEEMLENVLFHAASVLEAPHGFIDLVDTERQVLRRLRSVGRFAQARDIAFRPGEGLAGKVWQSRSPMRVEDYKHWPGRVRGVDLEWVRAAIAAPLTANGEVVGVLTLTRPREDRRPFGSEEEGLLRRFTQLASIAVQNVRLIEEIEARRRESEQLTRISNAMQEQSSLQDRMDLILQAITELVGLERAVIWLPTDDGEALETTSWTGFDDASGRPSHQVRLDDSVPALRAAFVTGEEVVVEADEPFPDRWRAHGMASRDVLVRSRSFAVVPLVSRGRRVGVLAVDNHASRRPLAPSLATLRRVAASAAVAIDSARLYEAVQDELAERKQAEEGLRRSEEKYRTILEQIEDAYFEADLRGRLTLVNPALARSVSRPIDEIVGESFRHFVAPGEVRGVLEAFGEAASSGAAVQRREVRYLRADGSHWYGETSIGRIVREDGSLQGFRGLVRNIEDRKRYELELEAAKEIAEQANLSKSAFLANVSHELRTPLTSILGFARLIERRFDEVLVPLLEHEEDRKVRRAVDQVRGNAQIIYRESRRLTTLINDVLDLAKIEAGRVDWNMQRLHLGDVVERALEATHGLSEARPEVRVVADVEPGVPPVEADPDRLVQVVINLISNAVKFTPRGDVTVRVERRADRAVVSVRDTGIGIAPEDHGAVFEQFKQVGDTLTDKPQGTGLGLPICKQIVEHHGGRIWLESAVGEGSTFLFDLPLAALASDVVPIAVDAPEVRVPHLRVRQQVEALLRRLGSDRARSPDAANGPNGSNGATASGATILVVDDDREIRALLRQELEETGHAVIEAADGRAALAAVATHRPDLVILDVMMPELSGFDVAAVLKNDPGTASIPIIILTVVQDPQRGYRLGVDRYLTKPVDMAMLLHEVQALLSPAPEGTHVVVVEDATDSEEVRALARRAVEALRQSGFRVTHVDALASTNGGNGEAPDLVLVSDGAARRDGALTGLRRSGRLGDAAVVVYG